MDETTTTPGRSNTPLWIVAAALGGLALAQVWGPGGGAAQAGESGMVTRAGTTTALTVHTGPEDLLFLLDGRSDELAIYRVDGRTGLQLMQRLPVGQIFVDARARSTGRP